MTSQSDRDAIIAKIKKCLALAKSSNEHEAATALRQAQKLMAAYSLTELDVGASDIDEQDARSGASTKPVLWECALSGIVAETFGCEVFFAGSENSRPGVWRFVGIAPAPEIAKYAYSVLFRQLKRARSQHIKSVLKRCGPATRSRRADLFCEGWIQTATSKLGTFSGQDEKSELVVGYLAAKYQLNEISGRDRNQGRSLTERDRGDLDSGRRSGRNAELHRGVGGTGDQKSLVQGATS